jgi:hypothetical protein
MIGDVGTVLKKSRKLGDRMTSVITPASYPKRNDPVAAKIARAMLKSSPMMRCLPRRPGGSEENDIQTMRGGRDRYSRSHENRRLAAMV